MLASARALLEGIIDYAGLFPPAKLPLDQAIRNHLRYQTEPESWLLGRFVCPVSRLPEIEPYLEGGSTPISALGQGGKTCQDFQFHAQADMEALSRFRQRLTIDIYEVKLPEIDLTASLLEQPIDTAEVATFFEVPVADKAVSQAARVLSETRRNGVSKRAGIKLRCGGLEAAAFPTADQLAFVVRLCRDAEIPLKFTAGLHHPIRHHDTGMNVCRHGFLNLFGAGVFAHVHGLKEVEIREIIADGDPTHFVFTDDDFRWKDLHATVAQIRAARKWLTSFGSCSLAEPCEDLRALGMLRE